MAFLGIGGSVGSFLSRTVGAAAKAIGGAVSRTVTSTAAKKAGRVFTPVNVARAVVNPASAVSLISKAVPSVSQPVAQLLSSIPIPQTQVAAAVLGDNPAPVVQAAKLPVLVRSGQLEVGIPEVIRKGGPMLPALVGTIGRSLLPTVGRVGGALIRGAGRVASSPAAQQVAASYVGTRLAQPGAPEYIPSQRGIRFGGGGGQFGYPRRRRRGISASDVKVTMRTLKTIKKLYSKLPKARSTGGFKKRRY